MYGGDVASCVGCMVVTWHHVLDYGGAVTSCVGCMVVTWHHVLDVWWCCGIMLWDEMLCWRVARVNDVVDVVSYV